MTFGVKETTGFMFMHSLFMYFAHNFAALEKTVEMLVVICATNIIYYT